MRKAATIIMASLLALTIASLIYIGTYTSRCPETKEAIMAVLSLDPPQGLLAGGVILEGLPFVITLSTEGDFTIFLAVDDGLKVCPISGSDWNFFAPISLAARSQLL